ncbi:MAG TPA: DUF4397 domain-containing protein [Jatrophihabitans sp.]|nr:DUF4397 domain-containing protein [Jatrophihabitans sp.]
MRIRRSRSLALVAVTGLGAGLIVLPPAAAASSAGAAMIRGGHFSPNTPGVDVYLTAFAGKTTRLWLSGVGYGDVSGYERFAPGLYAVSMRPHGAAPSTPAALSWTLDARPGAAYTACAVGLNAQLHGIVLHDDLQPAPAGEARVRVIQAASRAPRADVVATGGPALARGVAFSTSTNYTLIHAGDYTIKASAVGNPALQATTRASFAPDSVHTVVVLDARSRGITTRVLDDATGAAVAPVGAPPAGAGGTARAPDDWVYGAVPGLVAVLATAVAGALVLRKRRTT